MPTPDDALEHHFKALGYQVLYDCQMARTIYDGEIEVGKTDVKGRRWPLERAFMMGDQVVWFPAWAIDLYAELVTKHGMPRHDFSLILKQLKDNPEGVAALETVMRLGDAKALTLFAANYIRESAPKT